MRRPISVLVEWSESDAFYDGCDYTFTGFEARALKVAQAHKTGGYLKTAVTVTFDDGHTYGCRLDLAPHQAHGFEHHINTCRSMLETDEGQAILERYPESARDHWLKLAEVWRTMDFSPEPVAPAEECLPHGIQLLIPGIAPVAKPTKRGGDDRQARMF